MFVNYRGAFKVHNVVNKLASILKYPLWCQTLFYIFNYNSVYLTDAMYNVGACVDVLVNEEDVFYGFLFQDTSMKEIFSAYPELICVYATYKLLELRFPLYIILVEDGNGCSEVAAAFLLLEETEESLQKIIDLFKERNPDWPSVRVIMTDKDINERDVLARSFPNSNLHICLFHTFRTFRREISVEKFGISLLGNVICAWNYCNRWHMLTLRRNTWTYTSGLKTVFLCKCSNVLMIIGIQFECSGP